MQKTDIYADYGTQIIPAPQLAILRGTGNFNPGPNYDQSTNRGPVYSQALRYHLNTDTEGPLRGHSPTDNKYQKNVPMAFSDSLNDRPYQVGTTMLHPEGINSWNRQETSCSRGTDQYQTWAATVLNMTPNALMNFFFNKENVDHLQDTIINEVKRIQGVDIQKQSIDELLIIMQNKYTYAIQGYLPHPGNPNKPYPRGTIYNSFNGRQTAFSSDDNDPTSLVQMLIRLNNSVIEECVKSVLSGIIAYQKYYLDASSLPMPLSLPVYMSMKGSNVLQENLGFESGHDMSSSIASYNERFNII